MSRSLRGSEGSTASSPPATRFQTSSALAEAKGVNRRICAGSPAATRSVRPLVDTDAIESGTAWVTPATLDTRRRMASEIGLVLLSRMSGVRSGVCSLPGSSTEYLVLAAVVEPPSLDAADESPDGAGVPEPERSAEVRSRDSLRSEQPASGNARQIARAAISAPARVRVPAPRCTIPPRKRPRTTPSPRLGSYPECERLRQTRDTKGRKPIPDASPTEPDVVEPGVQPTTGPGSTTFHVLRVVRRCP